MAYLPHGRGNRLGGLNQSRENHGMIWNHIRDTELTLIYSPG